MNLKDEIKKVMNYLETIDFMDNSKRKENQRRVNKAYLKLEDLVKLEKEKNEKIRELESDLYEANNRINDLLDIVKQKDKIIDDMAKEILLKYQLHYKTVEDVKKIYEERCK